MDKITEGERRFRQLADNAPLLMWRADETMTFDWVNRAWLDFTGRELEDELGLGWADMLHADDRDALLDAYRDGFASGQPFTLRYRLRRFDGTFRWIQDNARPVHDERGQFAGYFGAGADVDDMMKANEALAEAVRQRAEAVAQRDHLLREVQHRVRNNLQLILSIIDMQARVESDESRRALSIVGGRVRSIAKAQALLLDPSGTAEVDLRDYALSLAQSAAGTVRPVSIEAPEEAIHMPIGRVVPLGLMINEIISTRVGPDGSEPLTLRLLRDDAGLRIEIEGTIHSAIPDAPSRLIERLGAQAGARIEQEPASAAKVVLRVDN